MAKKFLKQATVVGLVMCSLIVSLLIVEVGLRLLYLKNPWSTRNFTVDPVNQQVTNLSLRYDPITGFNPLPNKRDGTTHTNGLLGERLNFTLPVGAPSPKPPKNGILATGSSFTYGSEVVDQYSWPAQLEKILSIPVVNGGSGGYSLDQVILRTERLMDLLSPKAVIVGFTPGDAGRTTMSAWGGLTKPYFEVVDGEKLELRNVPVPHYRPSRKTGGWFRRVFGYSYLMFWLADRLKFRDQWLIFEAEVQYAYPENQARDKSLEITCLLWKKLANKAGGQNVRLFAIAQYAGIHVNGHDNSRDHYQIEKMLGCARDAGFVTVDSYPPLRAMLERDPKIFWNNWVKLPHDKEWHNGHMSKTGNHFTAELLAKAIRESYPELIKSKR